MPPPGCECVNAVDKELSGEFGVKAVDKGLTGEMGKLTVEGRRARLECIAGAFAGNVGGKGVRCLDGYFMGYYTIWLAFVKDKIVPFWELGSARTHQTQMKSRSPGNEGCGSRVTAR